MSDTGLLKKLLGIDLAVVESARTGEEDGSLAVEVRPRQSPRCRCPGCGKKAPSATCRRRRAGKKAAAALMRIDRKSAGGVFKSPDGAAAAEKLGKWLNRACRSWTKEIKELSKKVRRRREAIARAVELGVSNARVEAVNNKVKLTVRMGCGFRDIDNLIALAMLRCSNLPIKLPGRA